MVKSFPGITTKETSVVPPIKPKDWRETLGIVAKFRKGPPIARVRSLEDLANFFGDDNHEGALTIHTAMDNSTRDFVVSRPIPSDTSAFVNFNLETEGTPQQSYVDDSGDVPTHGISLLSEYVSDIAQLIPSESKVRSIKKNLNTQLEGSADFGDPTFKSYVEGQGTLNFRSELYFQGAATPANPETVLDSVKIYNPEVDGSRIYDSSFVAGDSIVTIAEIASLDGYNIDENPFEEFINSNIHPGVKLQLTAHSDATTELEEEAEVLSPPEKYYNSVEDRTAYRFAIRITFAVDSPSLGTDEWIELIDTSTPTIGEIRFPTESKYIFSYSWDSITANASPKSDQGEYISGMFPSYTRDSLVDGYLIFNQSSGVKKVELFNFFLEWNRDQAIQLSPNKPLNLIDLDINSVAELSSNTIGFSPSKLKMLDEANPVYDAILPNVEAPSTFAVRIDQALVFVGRPFTDTTDSIPALTPGTPFTEVVDSLFSQLNEVTDSSGIFSDFNKDSVYDKVSGDTTLKTQLETRVEGLTANNMTLRVSLTGDGTNVPSDVIADGWTTVGTSNLAKSVSKNNSEFELAKQGSKPASRIFYTDTGEPLVRIDALSPGHTDLEVSIKPRRSGQFDVIIVDRDSEEYYDAPLVERIMLTNKGANQNGSGIYPGSRNSKLIRAYYLPRRYNLPKAQREAFETKNPARIGANLGTFVPDANTFNNFEGIPSVSTLAVGEDFIGNNVKLLGGTDGSNGNDPSNEDYLEAVKRLESFDIVALTCPDIKFNGNPEQVVIKEIIRQAEDSDPFNGLRQAIFQLPRKLPVTRVKSIVPQSLNNERVVLVAGYTTYDQKPEVGFNQVPILGTYLGWTYSRPPFVSPAAISRTEVIKAATTTSIPTDEGYLSALSENGIEGIYFDKSVQRLRFANGQTTSTDIEGQYASVVRTYDQITMDLAQRLSFVRSQPLSNDLMRRVAGICDTRLEYLTSQGWISGYSPTIVDERNNTDADLRQGKLNVDINLEVFIPADHIILNFLRQRTKTLTLQTQT